jgi:hypothetical protein
MIIVGDVVLELELRPKLPKDATPERQDQIIQSLLKMLTEGEVFSGTSEARFQGAQILNKRTILLQVRLPDGRITIA